ncbi:cupin domain-containing protein [Rubellimicrobium rubrum]|uniref:Cupin domain-containing protein n=1 Tax=Rubellimicrobium rubrum TaxID=2585369 RepID=A0A5C4MNQ4_9RHOB|nr:cupin domain-containing protein [Rubellimicrobium rubrum]TNC47223.1 cupin domain-containing protein [Rubellimicrobium rubrum]
MNAFARGLSVVSDHSAAMARDLLGAAGLQPGPITFHTTLSSQDTGALSAVHATIRAGTCIAPHCHAHEDEVCLVVSGIAEFRMPDRILRRRAGESLLIPCGTTHEVRAVTELRLIAALTRHDLGLAAE